VTVNNHLGYFVTEKAMDSYFEVWYWNG